MAKDLDLAQYAGKKVIVVHTVEGEQEAQELEGTCEGANPQALLIKPKGKANLQLIEAGKIEDVRYVDEKPKAITAKTLKVVEFGKARAHLLERHGYTLDAVNKLSEKQAFEEHAGLDHVALNLGHVHGDTAKAEAPAEPAA